MNSSISSKQDDSANAGLLNIPQDHSLQYQQLDHSDTQYRDVSQQSHPSMSQYQNQQYQQQQQQQQQPPQQQQQTSQQSQQQQQPQAQQQVQAQQQAQAQAQAQQNLYYPPPNQQLRSRGQQQQSPQQSQAQMQHQYPQNSLNQSNSNSVPQDYNYVQNQNGVNLQTINHQQFSELMYNSFLSHFSQKQQGVPPMNNSMGSNTQMNPANAAAAAAAAAAAMSSNNTGGMGNSNNSTSYIGQPVQRYFPNNMSSSSSTNLLDPNNSNGSNNGNNGSGSNSNNNNGNSANNSNNNNNSTNYPSLLPPGMQPQLQQQLSRDGSVIHPHMSHTQEHPHNATKKLSSTQSRIERRKKLKKQGPKRPSSAYFLFSMSIRNELLQQFPEAKVPELSKLASAKWKELSDDEKKPYYDKFRSNWEKYRTLRDEYEKTLPPKRPSGPFIQFTQEVRPSIVKQNPDKGLIEITKIVGEKWRELDPAKKAEYTETYKRRLKEWESCYPDENENENEVVQEMDLNRNNNSGNNSSSSNNGNTNNKNLSKSR